MVALENLRNDKKAAILDVAQRHGARNVRLFGSVARGPVNLMPAKDPLS